MASKDDIINSFDPNGPGIPNQLFGLPFTAEHAEVIIVPAPWEVTVSYHPGTAAGPRAVLDASSQVDHFIKDLPEAWKLGINMLPIPLDMEDQNRRLRSLATQHIARVSAGEWTDPDDPVLQEINAGCEAFNGYIRALTKRYLDEGKLVGILGGDHSTPLGFIRTLCQRHDRFGILQIDAHADLRSAYEGFTYSHASIMYNALKNPSAGRLVQVGVRDCCEEEMAVIRRAMGRIVTFFDEDLKARMYQGTSWDTLCSEIIHALPPAVYISLDIDGLTPALCPNTGTPVAGGLDYEQFLYLLRRLVHAGKKIIGFDLSEVAPGSDDWDANVGARLLYQLSHWMAASQGRLPVQS